MLNFSKVPVYLYKTLIDGRAGIPTLCSYVAGANRKPTDGSLYIFSNKARNILKGVFYDGVSYWMVQRKLNKGKHEWILDDDGKVIALNRREVENLLKGLPIKAVSKFVEEYPDCY